MRSVRPEQTQEFAARHDDNVWSCLLQILGMRTAPSIAHVFSTLALSAGGLGLASAVRVRVAAHWSSWADSLRMIRQRHPLIAEFIVAGLADGPVPCFQAVREPNGRWLPLVSRCLRGLNCRILLQPERKTQNRTSQSSDGSRRRPGCWRRISLMRWCGQDWTTPAELCSGPSTGLLHLPFSLLSRRLESHGWTLSLSVFSCAGVCFCRFPFPCALADVRQLDMFGLICLPWCNVCHGRGLGKERSPFGMRSSPSVQRGWGTGVHKCSCQRLGPRRPFRCRRPATGGRG